MKILVGTEVDSVSRPMIYDRYSENAVSLYRENDYCRYRALELVCEQIGDRPGSVAEAGVAHGDFAFMINRCFPDRKLFLYDTFEGHDKKDAEYQARQGYYDEDGDSLPPPPLGSVGEHISREIKDAYTQALSKQLKRPVSSLASEMVAFVKTQMPFPERCIFRVGYFPETAAPDTDETFVFVSLDMNFYKPIYAGLEFFYPRLQEGGYIFIHDYNVTQDGRLGGLKDAVRDAEKALGPLKKFPLPDWAGTLVITK
ncbi:MAG: TylF/MycF family methyltransferase [Holosporales bacterium]|nr:TylF/MycF family methyltransferase [Holosporales bacterium]